MRVKTGKEKGKKCLLLLLETARPSCGVLGNFWQQFPKELSQENDFYTNLVPYTHVISRQKDFKIVFKLFYCDKFFGCY